MPGLLDPDRMKWQLCNGQTLRMLSGEDESVVYNDRSGETHLLSAMAVSLLVYLREGPDNVSGISARLARDWEFDTENEIPSVVTALTSELDALGLIEPCLP